MCPPPTHTIHAHSHYVDQLDTFLEEWPSAAVSTGGMVASAVPSASVPVADMSELKLRGARFELALGAEHPEYQVSWCSANALVGCMRACACVTRVCLVRLVVCVRARACVRVFCGGRAVRVWPRRGSLLFDETRGRERAPFTAVLFLFRLACCAPQCANEEVARSWALCLSCIRPFTQRLRAVRGGSTRPARRSGHAVASAFFLPACS